jgi:hypothetical protein
MLTHYVDLAERSFACQHAQRSRSTRLATALSMDYEQQYEEMLQVLQRSIVDLTRQAVELILADLDGARTLLDRGHPSEARHVLDVVRYHAAKLPLNAEQQAVIKGRIEALRVGLQTEATRP